MKMCIPLRKKEILRFLWVGVFLSLLFSSRGVAQETSTKAPQSLELRSDAPTISFLFNTPIERDVYSIYGHLGIRVVQPNGEDIVYNYGVFDFDAPNFILNFIMGTMDDYRLASVPTEFYINSYIYEADLYELGLNLSPEEALRMDAFLVDNLQPHKAYYRYNFIFDNCATRPFEALKEILSGELELKPATKSISRREMLDHCNTKRAWYKLGTDLSLGSSADEKVGVESQIFLPVYLIDILRQAEIVTPQGRRPLVKTEAFYDRRDYLPIEEYDEAEASIKPTPMWLTPTAIALITVGIVLLILLATHKKKTLYQRSSITFLGLFFLLQGVAGSIIFFLTFFSLHPLVSPNWNLLSLNPLHLLLGLPCLVFFSRKRVLFYTLLLNILGQLSYIILTYFVGLQTTHPALLLLALTSLGLSINVIILCKHKKNAYEQTQ